MDAPEPLCGVDSLGRPWGCGLWSGYVEAGMDRQARRARLSQVPAEYRERVRSHLRTVAQIKHRQPLTPNP